MRTGASGRRRAMAVPTSPPEAIDAAPGGSVLTRRRDPGPAAGCTDRNRDRHRERRVLARPPREAWLWISSRPLCALGGRGGVAATRPAGRVAPERGAIEPNGSRAGCRGCDRARPPTRRLTLRSAGAVNAHPPAPDNTAVPPSLHPERLFPTQADLGLRACAPRRSWLRSRWRDPNSRRTWLRQMPCRPPAPGRPFRGGRTVWELDGRGPRPVRVGPARVSIGRAHLLAWAASIRVHQRRVAAPHVGGHAAVHVSIHAPRGGRRPARLRWEAPARLSRRPRAAGDRSPANRRASQVAKPWVGQLADEVRAGNG